LLIDLDGVVRRWDPDQVAAVERRHGLPAGSIGAAAFGAGSALQDALTGRVTDAEWRADVVRRLAPLCGTAAEAAVAEWSEYAGAVDAEVLAALRTARAAGWRVGLLTNATSRLRDDLRRLGLEHEFDAVVSSAELGLAKPDPEVFEAACRVLDVDPPECVFVDDAAANVAAAAAAGLDAHLYTASSDLAGLLTPARSPRSRTRATPGS
jgi:putative hydrolase of the HAD superfamily